MTAELIALASSGIALIVSVGALYLDVRIIRHQEDHHGLLKDLHHHHIVKPALATQEAVTVDNGPSQEAGHEDCHGPVYRREAETPDEWYDCLDCGWGKR